MEFWTEYRTFGGGGASFLYGPNRDLLTVHLPGDYGSAIERIALDAFLPVRVRRHLSSYKTLYDQFDQRIERLPEVKF